ncbi:DUF6603 domain-containing protein [Streptomyces sp. MP131-18]|uniref:DUF6603 domain-containing protein n=1 Tax=Streptomyces sp. MP131-18 TaxID=1857892 RepID=UPI00209B0258|nr:DUF6603 domain-containing protein [Streptomyces sp. MP131-18]
MGRPPTLNAADGALPALLCDMLATFPGGSCRGVAGSGEPEWDDGRATLTLPLACDSCAWPAGSGLNVAVTGVTVTVTSRGVVTLVLSGAFDGVAVTSTLTADPAGWLVAAVRPVQPGAFAAQLEGLGRRFAGDEVWRTVQDGLREFGFGPKNVAGFDLRVARTVKEGETGPVGPYRVTSAAVVAALDIGALPLDIALWAPDLFVTGALRDQRPVPVRSLLESLHLPADAVPDVGGAVSELSFAAHLGYAYVLRTQVTGEWGIGPLAVTSLSLELFHDSVAKFAFTVRGTVTVGPSLAFDVVAARRGGAQGEWVLGGGLAAGRSLEVGALIQGLGLADVPEPVRTMELTGLSLSHTVGTPHFDFVCEGHLTIADGITASLRATVTWDGSGARYGGTLEIGDYVFGLVFDRERSGSDVFAATLHGAPEGTQLVLRDWVAHFSADLAADVPDGLRIGLKDAKFVRIKPANGPARFVVGVDLAAAFDLSRLPLVGGFLAAVGGDLAVENLQVLYGSGDLDRQAVSLINGLLGQAGVVPLPEAGLKPGVAALADMRIGGEAVPIALGVPSTSPAPAGGDGRAPAPEPPPGDQPPADQLPGDQPSAPGGPASNGLWVSVQKQIGVVQINRVGVLYQHNVLLFALDAGVTIGPLSLSLDGLAVGSPLDRFAPTFRLDGLGLAYTAPPVEISGALLHLPEDRLPQEVAFQYDGTATVALPSFSLAAVGSYAQLKDGRPSLFVFAQLEAPLGGPPPVLVTGLMAGFGFNRELALPTPGEVTGFPLLSLHKQGPDSGGHKPFHVLDVLEGREPAVPGGRARPWIAPREGSYWLGLGVEFTVAEVVNAKVLLAAEFGQELAFAVLGIATLQLPLPAESAGRTYVYAELGLEAVLRPTRGSFELSAQLSPASYVLTPSCHLTGGFACAVWFGPSPNAGQFVISLGGYHPAFRRPSHYPVVPRLGIDWAVSDAVSLRAEAYLALTPSCVMAGYRLHAVFHAGGIQAWFTAQADLLLSWRPFAYTARVAVSIGASYSLHLGPLHLSFSGSVGATLNLWGPPTGGTVTVHLPIHSITIGFGPGPAATDGEALGWSEFGSMLPKPEDVVTIAPVNGVDKTVPDTDTDTGAGHGDGGTVWLVRARDLRFFTQSALPASHLRVGDAPLSPPGSDDGPLVDIRPMNRSGLVGEHRLKLYRGNEPAPTDGWTMTARTRNLPASLWGAPPVPFSHTPTAPSADVLPDRPVGWDVQAPRPRLAPSRGVFPLSEYSEDELPPGLSPLPRQPDVNGGFAGTPDSSSVDLIGRADRGAAKDGRDQVYAALAEAGLLSGPNDALTGLAANAGHLYGQAPMTWTSPQDAGSRT